MIYFIHHNKKEYKIEEYADADEVEALPKESEFEETYNKIMYKYKKFLDGDCSPRKTELPELKRVLDKLKEVEAYMKSIYQNH